MQLNKKHIRKARTRFTYDDYEFRTTSIHMRMDYFNAAKPDTCVVGAKTFSTLLNKKVLNVA
jgi:hypothetical protein